MSTNKPSIDSVTLKISSVNLKTFHCAYLTFVYGQLELQRASNVLATHLTFKCDSVSML